MKRSQELGTKPIGPLLAQMAIPASIGILVMSIYFIVDTIFVGRWVGTLGIAAITVVMPITFFISSIGMAIGVGGSSIISRALGGEDNRKACHTFGNMASLTFLIVMAVLLTGSFFKEPLLNLFGARSSACSPMTRNCWPRLLLPWPSPFLLLRSSRYNWWAPPIFRP